MAQIHLVRPLGTAQVVAPPETFCNYPNYDHALARLYGSASQPGMAGRYLRKQGKTAQHTHNKVTK